VFGVVLCGAVPSFRTLQQSSRCYVAGTHIETPGRLLQTGRWCCAGGALITTGQLCGNLILKYLGLSLYDQDWD